MSGSQTVTFEQSRTINTKWDRNNVAVIPITGFEDAHTDLREESKRLVKAITAIHRSGANIDQIESFLTTTPDGAVLVIHPYTSRLTPATKTRQVTLDGASTDVREPLGTTIKQLNKHLQQLDVVPGRFPFGTFGSSSVVTTRVVPVDGRHVVPWGAVDPLAAGSTKLLTELQDEPFLYYCHTRHNPTTLPEDYEFQVVVRIALFDPQHQISTIDEMQRVYAQGRPAYPSDAFEPLNLTSSWKRIDDKLTVPPSFVSSNEVKFARNGPLADYRPTDPIITGHAEYEDILGAQYDADPAYDGLCKYTSIMARESDLCHFVGVTTVDPTGDPFATVPGRTHVDIDAITDDIDDTHTVSTSVTVKSTDDLEVLQKSRSTAQDGADDHWESVKDLAVTFRTEYGWDVFIVDQDGGSRPDLWVRTSGGEIFAIEVESSTRSKPANLFRNVTRQALWGYKTIVVIVQQENDDTGERESPDTAGDWARDKLAKPFNIKSRSDQFCRVPNRSETLTVEHATLLLPEGMTEACWVRTWEDELLLLPENVSLEDGTLPDNVEPLARGPATAPFSDYEFRVPRYTIADDGTVQVTDNDGDLLTTYADLDYIKRTSLYAPHRHVDLSYLQFVESIYCFNPDTDTLTECEIAASWDTDQAERRHELSHRDVLETFTLEIEGERLWEDEVRPFFRDWIGQMSMYGSPAKNIFGEYRQPYTNRRGDNERKFYDELTYRFSRGTVPPDQPGLRTMPTFPDEWLDDTGQRLRTPLIYGLSDRKAVDRDPMETDLDSSSTV